MSIVNLKVIFAIVKKQKQTGGRQIIVINYGQIKFWARYSL